ncbi:MAG TPA: phytanoyl-CoA dioxygenase family protein [Gammaproteobacteria bacterium]|nr:phytanoyl-CoA dioxygenase family protein [Gammaproteobacteria bacterium]
MFTASELEQFQRDGYLIVRGLAEPALCDAMVEFTRAALAAESAPVEYEADLKYPGAPPARDVPGGHTVRRLLQAYARHPLFRDWATHPTIVSRLRQLLGPQLVMPQAHHNCIMTKQPRFSSDTQWHQDIRYWSFARPELVNTWLALGPEFPDNGCLQLLPGTHTMSFKETQLDQALFLRTDVSENQPLLTTKVMAELAAGDVLFFHCRTFHAASRNRTDQPKFSVVFTYRPADNRPLAGSRSASVAEITLP